MGNLQAAEYASGQWCDLNTGLIAHLQSNHFPPIPLDNLEPAKEAIAHAIKGEWDAEVFVPTKGEEGGEVRVGDIIEGMHLSAFVEAAFFAQDNPCDGCYDVYGGNMDCGECPQYWKNEAEEGGYYVTVGVTDTLHQPDATSATEALSEATDRFVKAYGDRALANSFIKVREAGDPQYIDLAEGGRQ